MFAGASGLQKDDKTAAFAFLLFATRATFARGFGCISTQFIPTISNNAVPVDEDFLPCPIPDSPFGVIETPESVWDFYSQSESAWMGADIQRDEDVSQFISTSLEVSPFTFFIT
eukprot:TRINITY_DN7086_c0_g1_i1.p2 TRINITY_DN7086_c0_g1~~TRINITY_DN7086_c0_g1_i1.p2  ORF type:complete len:130 (-),score=19.73 TRINITY_DN7086_c0_g1_i1:279-620(-)